MKHFKIAFIGLLGASMGICVACSCSKDTPQENTQNNNQVEKPGPTIHEPVSKEIGKVGGKVSDNNVSINIPYGALSENTEITARYVESEAEISTNVSNNFLGAVEFGPSGTVFSQPVEVSLKMNSTPTNSTLSVFCYDPNNNIWDFVTEAGYSSGSATFEITHFSKYQVLDIDPEMFMIFVNLVHVAQETGQSDAWIHDSYETYLIEDKHVMDYYQEYDGYWYEPCGLRVFGKYQINGKEGNQGDLAIRIGNTNKAGNTYGVSNVGGLTVSRDEYNKSSSNSEKIDVTVTIDYKIINPDLTLSATNTSVKKGESTTVNVYCHYAKPGNVIYPDIALAGYPLSVSQPTHFTVDKVLITTNNSGRASFVATSQDGKEETLKVSFSDEGAYSEGKIKLNAENGYVISGHIVEEMFASYQMLQEQGIVKISDGYFKLGVEYDFEGQICEDENGLTGSISVSNITASLKQSLPAIDDQYDPWDNSYIARHQINIFEKVNNVLPSNTSINFICNVSSEDNMCSLSATSQSLKVATLSVSDHIVTDGVYDVMDDDIVDDYYIQLSLSSGILLDFDLVEGTNTYTSANAKDILDCKGFESHYGLAMWESYGVEFSYLDIQGSTTQTITISKSNA